MEPGESLISRNWAGTFWMLPSGNRTAIVISCLHHYRLMRA
ncbi:hypothetical protein IL54_1939 [Sphingobium sp. ba1]|nr:hypothetical protein IL54_1939 [Sphingobium sp. ba1]